MKKVFNLVLTLVALSSSALFAQEKTAPQTKFDQFLSSTGKIIRFEDSSLPGVNTDYDIVEVKVRKFIVGADIKYFYQLSKKTKFGTKTASIEYSDLLEILKVMELLMTNALADRATSIEYLESKFVADGFEIGYYKSKSDLKWYMDLAKYGTAGQVFFSNVADVKNSMTAAKDKIETMQSK